MIAKVSLGLNLLLIVAVIYLFSQLPSVPTENPIEGETDSVKVDSLSVDEVGFKNTVKVAYFLGDSINEKYKFLEDSRDELISKTRKSDDKVRREMEEMESRYIQLMQKQQTGGFTSQQEVLDAEQELQDRQIRIEELQNSEAQNIARFERNMQEKFFKRIQDFTKRYAEEKGIDMVVNIQQGGAVIYADEANDITSEVVRQLNEEYEQELAEEQKAE